jgi:hypothetical protein
VRALPRAIQKCSPNLDAIAILPESPASCRVVYHLPTARLPAELQPGDAVGRETDNDCGHGAGIGLIENRQPAVSPYLTLCTFPTTSTNEPIPLADEHTLHHDDPN